jgi:drug/metabolite transporter (DMT)-like permease
MNRQLKAELALTGVVAIWGATFVLVKSALDDASTILFLGIRFTAAAILLAFVYRKHLRRGPWWPGIGAAVLLFAGYATQTMGLRLTTAAKTGFITGLGVVLVPLICTFVYRVWPHPSELLGMLTATAGMGLLTLDGDSGAIAPGDLLVLACAVLFAGHTVWLAHFSRSGNFERISVIQIAGSAVLGLAFAPVLERPYLIQTPRLWIAIAVTAVFATAVAFTVLAWAQQYTTPTRTALIYSLEPVVAWATAYWVAGEVLSPRAIVGAVLILAGILVVELKPLGANRHLPE